MSEHAVGDLCEHGVPAVEYCRTCEQIMPPGFAEKDAVVEAVAAISARLEDYLEGLACYGSPGGDMWVDSRRDDLIADLRNVVSPRPRSPQSRPRRTRPLPPVEGRP